METVGCFFDPPLPKNPAVVADRLLSLLRCRPKTAGDDIVDNYPQFEAGQKTREIAAQKAGFGSEFTYRQAKTVVQNASPELKAQGEVQARSMTFAPTFTESPAKSRDCGSREG